MKQNEEVIYEAVAPLLNRVGYVETEEAIQMVKEKDMPIPSNVVSRMFHSFMATMEEQKKAIRKGPGYWLILRPNEKLRAAAMVLVLLFAFACKKDEPAPRAQLGYRERYNVFEINYGGKVEQRATATISDSAYAKSSVNGAMEFVLNVAKDGGYSSRLVFGATVIGQAIKGKSTVSVEANTATEIKVRYKINFTNSQVMDGFIWVTK
jgi:hypothetical protein